MHTLHSQPTDIAPPNALAPDKRGVDGLSVYCLLFICKTFICLLFVCDRFVAKSTQSRVRWNLKFCFSKEGKHAAPPPRGPAVYVCFPAEYLVMIREGKAAPRADR